MQRHERRVLATISTGTWTSRTLATIANDVT